MNRTGSGGMSLGNFSNKNCNHDPCDENGDPTMTSQPVAVLNKEQIMGISVGIENELVVDSLKPSTSDRTIMLNDDIHTQEVLCDLGLLLNGPRANRFIINTLNEYNSQVRLEGVYRPDDSNLSVPPEFENSLDQNKILSFQDALPLQNTSVPYARSSNIASESESEEIEEDVNVEEDVYVTWEVGRKLGLSTSNDGDTIQALIEEKDEWKSAKKRRHSNGKKKRGKLDTSLAGVSISPKSYLLEFKGY